MVASTCQAEGCDGASSAGTAFCDQHQTGFRWTRGSWIIHCQQPGHYLVVHKWIDAKKTVGSFEEAEAIALAPKRRPSPSLKRTHESG